MSEYLELLVKVDIADVLPSIPMISEAVISSCFRENKGVVKEKPAYAISECSYGLGHIVMPPGSRITSKELSKLRDLVIMDLEKAGFPLGKKLLRDDKAVWDKALGASLFDNLKISFGQTGEAGVWAYLTLFVFWDFPTWRFPKNEEADEPDLFDSQLAKKSTRPFARSAGGPRNVLRKCWDRAFVLGPDLGTDGLAANVQSLGEDELVNIFERTTIGNNRYLAAAIVETILLKRPLRHDRMEVVRLFTKVVLRKTPTTHFASLGRQLGPTLSDIFDSAIG